MLDTIGKEEAVRLKRFLVECGYTQDSLDTRLGSSVPPTLPSRPKAMYLTGGDTPLNLLLRLFFLNVPVASADAHRHFPEWLTDTLLNQGLVSADGDNVRANVSLVPVEEFILASDPLTLDSMTAKDFVLPASSATAHYLLNFMLRSPATNVLDLGTGCGVLALFAARFSDRVVATDINPRACMYAEFNAKLNDLDNIVVVEGDLFDPVADQEFDLIVTNPPFVLAPSSDFVYRDNDMVLDEFCAMLAATAPKFLREGGRFQMICEWVETGSEPWHNRLERWFKDTGCDAWVLYAAPEDPVQYAEARIAEASVYAVTEEDSSLGDWIEYYRGHDVKAVHNGIITMRRRKADNWIRLQAMTALVQDSVSDSIENGMRVRDFLDGLPDDQALLEMRPAVSSGTRLRQDAAWSETSWRTTEVRIRIADGLQDEIRLDQPAITFLALFDGSRTIGQSLALLAEANEQDPDEAARMHLPNVRALIERGFLELPL